MIFSYLIIINILGFIICYIDKYRAINNKYRIKEIHLLLISFIGGCIGFYFGMFIFNHKTRKLKFKILIPIFIVLWIIIIKELDLWKY